NGLSQRNVASRRRPLAGMYSASAQELEGRKRVDLMLSNLRRPCDDGAKLDAWAVQLSGTNNTSLNPANPACTACQITYLAAQAFLQEADLSSQNNSIIVSSDSTFYFHFGTTLGLGACDDTTGNPKANCVNAITRDFVDMSNMSAAHASGLKLNG